MDFQQLPSLVPAIATIFASFLFLYFILRKLRVHSRRRLPPEARGAWPIIGHLHLLSGPEPPFKALGHMADKHGPIFTIRMGVHRALVVSSWEIAKECFTKNDSVFANRPKGIASEVLTYNYAMFGLSPYGPYWRHARKITTLELLSNHRLEMLSHVRQSEVKTAIKELYELSVKDKNQVEMKEWFGDITLNMLFRMVVGKRYLEATSSDESDDLRSKQYRKALRDFFEFTGTFLVSDAMPYLRWLDLGGFEKAMKKTAKELDILAQVWLEEHKRKRVDNGEEAVNKGQPDFMDVMLSILDDAQLDFSSYDADTINKALSLTLILAGTDTTTVTMTWALALLLNNRDALKKAQQELDQHLGRERQVKEQDLKKLVYLQAIVKETMRLYPAGPLSLPHEAMEDCTVSGYHVGVGTRLLVNLSKLQRDPKVWAEPNEFRPERFLTGDHKNIDIRGQDFELIPFGSGRRMCPAVSLALQISQLTLASLLHGFEILTPLEEPVQVDMSETIGLTNLKATPLNVVLIPRLSAQAYY